MMRTQIESEQKIVDIVARKNWCDLNQMKREIELLKRESPTTTMEIWRTKF